MLKEDWLAVPAGEIYPKLFRAGEVLTGELLARAMNLGLIEDSAEEEKPAPKSKARRK